MYYPRLLKYDIPETLAEFGLPDYRPPWVAGTGQPVTNLTSVAWETVPHADTNYTM